METILQHAQGLVYSLLCLVQGKVSFRRAIQLQAQQYKRCLMESIPYEPFLRAM
jgi:hypothetical protein